MKRPAAFVGGFLTAGIVLALAIMALTATRGAGACGIASPAFCETFDAPSVPTNRSGELNGLTWGVSRTGNENPTQNLLEAWNTPVTVCGQSSQEPLDVRICNGQVHETVNDGGLYTTLAMYPKQPFDFAGRTGVVTFDVNADSQGTHAAWPEFTITDKPVPAPVSGIDGGGSTQIPMNGFGFALARSVPAGGYCGSNQMTTDSAGVIDMWMSTNYVFSYIPTTIVNCVTKGSLASLNHFEVRISQTHVEVWGTDPGSTTLKQLAVANTNLPLTRGLIWITDAHYNACKEGQTQCNHEFAWDNVGFDGPFTYLDRTYDVLDSHTPSSIPGQTNLGWSLGDLNAPTTLTTLPVDAPSLGNATAALVVYDWWMFNPATVNVRLNGGPWHANPWPYPTTQTFTGRTGQISVPLAEIVVGPNLIEFAQSGNTGPALISNVDIVLVAGGGSSTATPSPTSTPSSTASPSPTPSSTPSPTATVTPSPTPTASPTPSPTCRIEVVKTTQTWNGRRWVNGTSVITYEACP